MANNRGYGGPNVMLMRSESSSTDTLVAMLASCSPVAMQVPRSVGGLEDAVVGCGQKRSFYPTFENVEEPGDDDVGDDCTHNVEKKRRLTFDQVRSLERNFELENKLEPERKMQLAKELGLQPRQVAVWFQNRRARWKTKQLERDYEVLTLDYNRLKSDFDSVLQEKQELQAEIECLTGKLKTQEQPSSEALETSKCESASHLSPKKVSEVSVKSERVTELVTSREPLPARKEKDPRATSSDSTSSEILDADSPRTIDSGLSVAPTDKTNICPQIATDISLESNIMHIADELCEGVLSPQACHQRIAVKLEEGNFPEESCNYLLTQLDEQGALPWWDWP